MASLIPAARSLFDRAWESRGKVLCGTVPKHLGTNIGELFVWYRCTSRRLAAYGLALLDGGVMFKLLRLSQVRRPSAHATQTAP